jgi:hypothetical protein
MSKKQLIKYHTDNEIFTIIEDRDKKVNTLVLGNVFIEVLDPDIKKAKEQAKDISWERILKVILTVLQKTDEIKNENNE